MAKKPNKPSQNKYPTINFRLAEDKFDELVELAPQYLDDLGSPMNPNSYARKLVLEALESLKSSKKKST